MGERRDEDRRERRANVEPAAVKTPQLDDGGDIALPVLPWLFGM